MAASSGIAAFYKRVITDPCVADTSRELQVTQCYVPRILLGTPIPEQVTKCYYAPLVLGISLLTLVPGELGGTETYARELTRALFERGELEYRVFVPALGVPGEVVPEYRARWAGVAG